MNPELWALAGAGAVALIGAAVVLRLYRPPLLSPPKAMEAARKGVRMECSVCQAPFSVQKKDLRMLSPVERALTVRSLPRAVKLKLAEFVCPHCEAAHCFNIAGAVPEYLGANFYEPQQQSAVCRECRKRLSAPPWSPGAYDGRLREAPNVHPDYGLVCPYCHSACCVACCEQHTRRRTADGSLQCPRCDRGPQETFLHLPRV